jgi:AraC family transcriptional regulator
MTDHPYRTDFPDLSWLRSTIAERRDRGLGWPSIIHHVHTGAQVRDGIDGPFSIFCNLAGTSTCTVEARRHVVSERFYVVSNPRQIYTLDYTSPTETFNLHVADGLAEQLYQAGRTSLATSFDTDAVGGAPLLVRPTSTRMSDELRMTIMRARDVHLHTPNDVLACEEARLGVIDLVLRDNTDLLERIRRLPVMKRSTRDEVARRLLRVREAMHEDHSTSASLDDLAAIACMSKFHFLRAFTAMFGRTPHQYIMELRVDAARLLLRSSSDPFADIAVQLGCESVSSFAALFKRVTGSTPGAYRSAQKAQFWRATALREQRRFASSMLN